MRFRGVIPALLLALGLVTQVQAANVAISAFPAVTTAGAADVFPLVASGVTSKITTANLRTLLVNDPELTCIAALTSAANKGIVFTGSGTCSLVSWSATGQALVNLTMAVGDIISASSAATPSIIADVATGNVLLSGGVTTLPAYGKVGLTTHVSGTLAGPNGGTDNASYAVGDVLAADTTTHLSKVADVATGNVLRSGGTSTLPAYGKVALTTDVSGVLPQANGGITTLFAKATSDSSGFTSATVADTVLTATLVAAHTYHLDCLLLYTAAAGTTGINMAVVRGAGTHMFLMQAMSATGGTNNTVGTDSTEQAQTVGNATGGTSGPIFSGPGVTSVSLATITGSTNITSGGAETIQVGTEVAASAIVVKAGSQCIWTDMG